jgi:predicted RNA binding protein YcfA (HicA-like mRNA interferase family)
MMTKLPRFTSKKLLSALLRAGFYIHHQIGSHINLRHTTKRHLHIVIPLHNKDLAPKTIKSILSQAEINLDDIKKI